MKQGFAMRRRLPEGPVIEVIDKHPWDLRDREGRGGGIHHPFEKYPVEVASS